MADNLAMKSSLDKVIDQVGQIVLGKERQIRLALVCLLARGHLLIEDLPGVGKTTLALAIAKSLDLQHVRIQFTSDMLPADILGVSVYQRGEENFIFHPGPIFSQLILADEVNRATPKTQSALLEVMEECQVTIDGKTRRLPKPFFVIATQNPTYQIGTFPLPESQLDRFLMRIRLGYPDNQAERALYRGRNRRAMLAELQPCLDSTCLREMQLTVLAIHASEPLIDYVHSIVDHSRQTPSFAPGLSPRAGLALLQCAKAWAFMEERDHVIPEDIQTVLPSVVGHRLRPAGDHMDHSSDSLTAQLTKLPIP